ncbi:MAG: hypothetical protein ACK4FF_05375 [Limnobacter sp.]|uniref:hypothetical protein n=1 Tax=Limnobacter sp. TaxID=2003368 RepID=UPI00391B6412
MARTTVVVSKGTSTVLAQKGARLELKPAQRSTQLVLQSAVTGPRGLPGPSGGLNAYEHSQPSASASWLINHNLGRRPIVSVYSIGGMEVNAEVVHLNTNQTQILFAAPQTGFARLI